ncbi:hypothetical protein ACHAQH_004906 [Verticillium albo-atrum]
MPYNRAKGRTSEIPPSPSPGASRLGVNAGDSESRSRAGSLSITRLISPRDIDARLESQLAARRADERCWVRWPAALLNVLIVRPVGFVIGFIGCLAEHTPAVVPAVLAMVFLYVGMPLLIARNII